MEMRTYDKAELAMLYFPKSTPKVATNRLGRWIKRNPQLYASLQQCHVSKYAKYWSCHQVKLIVEYLDEP